MDLSRYLSLYLAETQEHLRALNHALLQLERAPTRDAVEAAFRAVHTIKGMAATMGHHGVTEHAHRMEDELTPLRGGAQPAAQMVDALLAGADALEREVLRATSDSFSTPVAETLPPRPVQPEAPLHVRVGGPVAPPEGAETAVVRFRPDAPLLSVRALMARRNLEACASVLGSDPPIVTDDFQGEWLLFLARGFDPAAVERAIRSAGDVDFVQIGGLHARSLPDTASAEAPSDPAPGLRHQMVRIEQRRLDELADGVGELSTIGTRLQSMAGDDPASELAEMADRMRRTVSELQESVLAARMVPVSEVFDRFPRVVRDAARSLGKEVDFSMEGTDIQLDRSILQDVAEPLLHLLRNAVAHGVESPEIRMRAGKNPRGSLLLRASRVRSTVQIEVSDDGAGIDAAKIFARARELGLDASAHEARANEAVLRILSHSGFSTASSVSDVSGRGVGLDVVVRRVRVLGGVVDLASQPGRGTTFTLRLPITLAVAQALRVRVGDEDYAVPLTHVSEALELEPRMLTRIRGREVVRLRGDVLPLVRLRQVLGNGAEGGEGAALVAEIGSQRTALAVDALVGREQIVVKTFDAAAGTLPIFSGATLLADGRPALVLDPASVL